MGPRGVGIVGLGEVASAHIAALRLVEGFAVVAACSRRAHDPAALERQHGVPLRLYDDYAALLADPEVEVVDLCTTHDLHAAQAVAAARAGKHLIVEKPLAMSPAELVAVEQEVRASGVGLCVCFELRFTPHVALVRSLLEQGLLGALHYLEVDYVHGFGPWYRQFDWNARRDQGGSSLLTAGCHALDTLLGFVSAPLVEVTAYGAHSRNPTFAAYEYPPATVALLRFADGTVGKVASVLDAFQPYTFRMHLVGSEGAVLDDRFHSNRLDGLDREQWTPLATQRIASGAVDDHPYEPMFRAFAASLAADQPMPLTGLAEASATHRAIFAADRSVDLGRPVKLSEVP